jgi:hypothetical protein
MEFVCFFVLTSNSEEISSTYQMVKRKNNTAVDSCLLGQLAQLQFLDFIRKICWVQQNWITLGSAVTQRHTA